MNPEIVNLVRSIKDDAELGRRVRALVNLLSSNNSPFGENYNSNNTGHPGFNSGNNKGLLNG
ncbi:hypothetical protein OAA15_00540 [bacterium]|nr:hypothetical protein [bacterium]